MIKAYLDLLDKAVCTVNNVSEHKVEQVTEYLWSRLVKFNHTNGYSRDLIREILNEQNAQPRPKSYGPTMSISINFR